NLAQAKSTYRSIAANIAYATVTSPFDGFVGAIPYREGYLVSATSAKPLTTVASIENVFAYFSMNETDYLNFIQHTKDKKLQDKIEYFHKVELILDNGQAYVQTGIIETITSLISINARTVSFRAVFKKPNLFSTRGNGGTIKIPKQYQSALEV